MWENQQTPRKFTVCKHIFIQTVPAYKDDTIEKTQGKFAILIIYSATIHPLSLKLVLSSLASTSCGWFAEPPSSLWHQLGGFWALFHAKCHQLQDASGFPAWTYCLKSFHNIWMELNWPKAARNPPFLLFDTLLGGFDSALHTIIILKDPCLVVICIQPLDRWPHILFKPPLGNT